MFYTLLHVYTCTYKCKLYPTDHQNNYISAQTSTRELYKCEHAIFERDSPLKRQIFFTTFNFKGAQNSTSLLPI